jgi:cytochrome c oxidase subunit 2
MNIFTAAGPSSLHIAKLSVFVLGFFSVVTLVMWALVLWTALRRKGSFREHAPWNDEGNRSWILVGGLTIPIVAFGLIFMLGLRTMAALPMETHAHEAPQLRVIGHQWWWEVQYVGASPDRSFVTANEIHIPADRPINIELLTRDVIHSFWLPRLHGKVDLIPGARNTIQLDALQPGFYEGHCAEFCGAQHAKMHLLLKAETDDNFQRWVTQQLSPATAAQSAEESAGEQLFMSHACALCHTIRGTDARGTAGPDLTHVGSRLRIASNVYPNGERALETWVSHAQSLKPNSQMPDIAAFSETQLHALAAFLQHLT